MKTFALMTAAALTATTAFVSISQVEAAPLHIEDHSFENATGKLNNGVLGLILPQTSGTIGGWQYHRAGLPVPDLGAVNVGNFATDGNNVARIGTLASVGGHASISQTLTGQGYASNTRYTLSVDVSDKDVVQVLDKAYISLTAGGQAVAISGSAALLTVLDLNPRWSTWQLVFETGDTTPTGDIGIRLGTYSLLDALSYLAFDNVRLDATALNNGGDNGGPSVVPTPAAAPLALMGLGLLGFRRRRDLV